jgi:hypothetical protein
MGISSRVVPGLGAAFPAADFGATFPDAGFAAGLAAGRAAARAAGFVAVFAETVFLALVALADGFFPGI